MRVESSKAVVIVVVDNTSLRLQSYENSTEKTPNRPPRSCLLIVPPGATDDPSVKNKGVIPEVCGTPCYFSLEERDFIRTR